ncbi:MAG: DNA adenine methylase [Acidithiobacillus sp.]|nr:DNA adenine methylase [Acidithiobacillus sp.]
MNNVMNAEQLSRPVMRYHGGKWRIAEWIMGFFPPHFTYVEPFGGSASVLMQKPRSKTEVYNDLDDQVFNVFSVLRDKEAAQSLIDACRLTPYSRKEFELSYQPDDGLSQIEKARRTLFRAFAGYGSAGATKGRTGFRSYAGDKRSASPAMDWANYPDHIARFCSRLQGVLLESRPALDIIGQFDSPKTLFYLDPPYLHETRSMYGGKYYRHEMSNDDHVALLDALQGMEGMAILSGYASPLYQKKLTGHGWMRFDKSTQANGRSGTVKRTETLWINPACLARSRQQSFCL